MKFTFICAAFLAVVATAGHVSAETLKIKVSDVAPGHDLFSKEPIVTLTLSPESKAALGAFTQARVGEQIKLRVGDKVLTEPVIREPILQGSVVINGRFSEEDAQDLAFAVLKAGGYLEVVGSDR